jgi:hypothetical protein
MIERLADRGVQPARQLRRQSPTVVARDMIDSIAL